MARVFIRISRIRLLTADMVCPIASDSPAEAGGLCVISLMVAKVHLRRAAW
jgi:hypothetical protein